jgi:hypothetical protein
MNLANLWRELEADWHAQSGFCSRRIPETGAWPVYLAVEKPSNHRSMLVVGSVPPGFRPPESRGLTVRAIEPTIGAIGTVTLAVVLRDGAFAGVFDTIVDDLRRSLVQCTREEAVMETVVRRVRLWQLFLEKQGDRGLGREGQLGLYGELWFLKHFLLGLLRPAAAVNAWTGPMGTHQDFQLGANAFEVKATTAKQHQRLQISSERQLDATGLEALFLIHLSLEARQGAGETLPEAVAAIRTACGDDSSSLADLSDRLIAAGYSDEHAANYKEVGFTEREHNVMVVSGSFPRITEAELRPGVGDVRYSVSVAECLHYATADAVLTNLLGGGTSGHR